MVTVNIDGKTLEVPEGTTVLKAAQMAGIQIPTLCDHPHLTPYGGCRLCLVEVEGARTLQPSCTLPVGNNMVVKTDTEKTRSARKFVLTLIFSERNHFCPYCQVSGGDCELQNAAYAEGMTHWPLQPNWQPYAMDASHPYIVLENNRCILCRRCVRACGELVGNFTLGFEERGAKSILVADTGLPLGESSCISCGTCVDVCPTGALIDRWSAYRGRETQVDKTTTVCIGCSVGCSLDVLTRDNNLIRIEADMEGKVNEGVICELGRFKPMDDTRERVITPMVRKNGKLVAATWDDALKTAHAGLKPTASTTLAALASTRLPLEALASFKQIFADSLGCKVVTSLEEGEATAAFSTVADELKKSFEGSLADLRAADGVLAFSADLVKDHQVAGFFVKRNLPLGTSLVVVDQKENTLDVLANKALKAGKGSNLDVITGLMAAIVKLGLGKGKTSVKAADLDAAAAKTGIATDAFLDAAFLFGSTERPVIVAGKGARVDEIKALLELAALTGGKLVSTKGKSNSLAAAQLKLDQPVVLKDQKAVVIALGDDEVSQTLAKNLEAVPYKVVLASYCSPVTAMADVVFPVANWLEQDGHYVNLEGIVQEAHKSLTAAEDVRTSAEALSALAVELGVKLSADWKKMLAQRTSVVSLQN